jgi:hypothetical protein
MESGGRGLPGQGEAVKAVENAQTGRIHTVVTIRVEERLRGRFPDRVTVQMDGGSVPGRGEQVVGMPVLKPGIEQLFYLLRKAGGRSHAMSRRTPDCGANVPGR